MSKLHGRAGSLLSVLFAVPTASSPMLLNGCQGFDCEAVVQRLASECKLAFGPSLSCIDYLDDPSMLEGKLFVPEIEACELADTTADETCLLTASCQEISEGACFSRLSLGTDSQPCFDTCYYAYLDCSSPCTFESADFEGCRECDRACVEALFACQGRC